MVRFAFAAAMLALAACAGSEETPRDPNAISVGAELDALAQDGREIAEAECAQCHAVGEYGDSPNPMAPTFRTVLSRYRSEVLQEELVNGIRVAHPMPDFQFNPQSTDALIMYLQSIQETPTAN
jgi:cytochrome c